MAAGGACRRLLTTYYLLLTTYYLLLTTYYLGAGGGAGAGAGAGARGAVGDRQTRRQPEEGWAAPLALGSLITIDAFASTDITSSSRTFRCVSLSAIVGSMALHEVLCDLQGATAAHPSCSRFTSAIRRLWPLIGRLSGGVCWSVCVRPLFREVCPNSSIPEDRPSLE